MTTSPKPASDRTTFGPAPSPADDPEPTGSVIVGIDGSDCAELALRWALNKTATLGRITPVSVYQPPSTFDLLTSILRSADPEVYRSVAETELRKAVAATDAELGERVMVIEGQLGPGLVEAAKDADLLVVGTRGRGGVSATILGSVSAYCVRNATVPTVVIPPAWPSDEGLEIVVVGVDGSKNADAALRWAVDHVAPNGRVIAAGAGSVYGYMGGEFDPSPALLETQIRHVVEEAIGRLELPAGGGPEILVTVDPTDARVALSRIASKVGADLLVLGARGMTGTSFLLLGSVSTALVHHPTLPTLIVPGGDKT